MREIKIIVVLSAVVIGFAAVRVAVGQQQGVALSHEQLAQQGHRPDGSTLTPFIDYANGGSSTEWITTLDNILKLDFDTAIPGHGPVMKKDDVRRFRQKFQTLRQRMTDLIKSGVKKEELAAKLKTDDLNWPLQFGCGGL